MVACDEVTSDEVAFDEETVESLEKFAASFKFMSFHCFHVGSCCCNWFLFRYESADAASLEAPRLVWAIPLMCLQNQYQVL